ncbi:MAG: hypothetical protein Q9208_002324 [Pyrenodesmia sp. 3 TL-2023]
MASYLITGASRGFGLALAQQLASLPASDVSKIFAPARGDAPTLEELVKKSPGRVVYVQLDVTSEASIKQAAAEVEANLTDNGLDVLINNAGFNLTRSGGGGDNIGPGSDAPDPFTERLLHARLADSWRSIGPLQGAEYDMVVGEERYDKFCCEYLPQLPPAFALENSDRRWDKRLPKLQLQRQLLHIAIYDSLRWNFRPLLLLHNHDHMDNLPLPTYKRVLLGSQEKALAVAALRAIDGVMQLHALLGGSHTRFAGLVFSRFEAAVVLVYLCMDPMFPRDYHHRHVPQPGTSNTNTDPLQTGIPNITRQGCLQAVQGALKRLRMLADVNSMADIGASTLTRLLSKVSETSTRTGTCSERGSPEPEPRRRKHSDHNQNNKLSARSNTSCRRNCQLDPLRASGPALNEGLYVNERYVDGRRHGELVFFRPIEYGFAERFCFDECNAGYEE